MVYVRVVSRADDPVVRYAHWGENLGVADHRDLGGAQAVLGLDTLHPDKASRTSFTRSRSHKAVSTSHCCNRVSPCGMTRSRPRRMETSERV
jgi:hypothetical protein